MAETQVFISGKCKYCHVHAPDKFGFRSVNIYMNDASKTVWAGLKEKGIMNRIRSDDDGEFVTLRSPALKKMKGELRAMDPIHVIKDGIPFIGRIGDGSDLTCMVALYDYKKPVTQEKNYAIRLVAVKVNNLIEASIKEFPPEGQAQATALIKQPDPIW